MSHPAELIGYPAEGLAGERVKLRTWRRDDAAALANAWADADVARWTAVPEDATAGSASRWIAATPALLEAGRSLDLVICAPADDTVLGEVGLAPIDWERGIAEVGYWIDGARRGQGLATEALRLLTQWALAELPLRMLVACCHPDNSASVAVAERAGYGFVNKHGEGHLLYVCRRPTGLLA